jgi:hypothetical protein
MIKAGSGTSKGSSLTILEVDLDVIIVVAFQHFSSQFEESNRFKLSFNWLNWNTITISIFLETLWAVTLSWIS